MSLQYSVRILPNWQSPAVLAGLGFPGTPAPVWTDITNTVDAADIPSISIGTEREDVPLTPVASDMSVTCSNVSNIFDSIFNVDLIVGPNAQANLNLRAPLVHYGTILFCRKAPLAQQWQVMFFGYIDPATIKFDRQTKKCSFTAFAPVALLEKGNAERIHRFGLYGANIVPARPFVLSGYSLSFGASVPSGVPPAGGWWSLVALPGTTTMPAIDLPILPGDQFQAVNPVAIGSWIENMALQGASSETFTVLAVVQAPDGVSLLIGTDKGPGGSTGISGANLNHLNPWFQDIDWSLLVSWLCGTNTSLDAVVPVVGEVNQALIAAGVLNPPGWPPTPITPPTPYPPYSSPPGVWSIPQVLAAGIQADLSALPDGFFGGGGINAVPIYTQDLLPLVVIGVCYSEWQNVPGLFICQYVSDQQTANGRLWIKQDIEKPNIPGMNVPPEGRSGGYVMPTFPGPLGGVDYTGAEVPYFGQGPESGLSCTILVRDINRAVIINTVVGGREGGGSTTVTQDEPSFDQVDTPICGQSLHAVIPALGVAAQVINSSYFCRSPSSYVSDLLVPAKTYYRLNCFTKNALDDAGQPYRTAGFEITILTTSSSGNLFFNIGTVLNYGPTVTAQTAMNNNRNGFVAGSMLLGLAGFPNVHRPNFKIFPPPPDVGGTASVFWFFTPTTEFMGPTYAGVFPGQPAESSVPTASPETCWTYGSSSAAVSGRGTQPPNGDVSVPADILAGAAQVPIPFGPNISTAHGPYPSNNYAAFSSSAVFDGWSVFAFVDTITITGPDGVTPSPQNLWPPSPANNWIKGSSSVQGIAPGATLASCPGVFFYHWNGSFMSLGLITDPNSTGISLSEMDFGNAVAKFTGFVPGTSNSNGSLYIMGSDSNLYIIRYTLVQVGGNTYNFQINQATLIPIDNPNYLFSSETAPPTSSQYPQGVPFVDKNAMAWITGQVIQDNSGEPDYTDATDAMIVATASQIYIVSTVASNLVTYADFTGQTCGGALSDLIVQRGYTMISGADQPFVNDPASYAPAGQSLIGPSAHISFRARISSLADPIPLSECPVPGGGTVNLVRGVTDGVWMLLYESVSIKNSKQGLSDVFNDATFFSAAKQVKIRQPRFPGAQSLELDLAQITTQAFAKGIANGLAGEFLVTRAAAAVTMMDPYILGLVQPGYVLTWNAPGAPGVWSWVATPGAPAMMPFWIADVVTYPVVPPDGTPAPLGVSPWPPAPQTGRVMKIDYDPTIDMIAVTMT